MKLAIVVRKDLGMRTGKIAVQVGHASVIAYRIACGTDEANQWFDEGQKKIVLKCADEVDMEKIGAMAQMNGLQVNPVVDFGLTQIEPNTTTCIAIGPDDNEKIDRITTGLSLL
jgi:PTH2 family peptidyl-tRNA hydrolase